MQKRIDTHNTALMAKDSAPSNTSDDLDNGGGVVHVQLGSRSNQLTLSLLEDLNQGDPAFRGLEARVRAFIALVEPEILPVPTHPIKVSKIALSQLMSLSVIQGL